MSHLSWANSAFTINLEVAGFRALTADIARKSFREAGFWPMNFPFVHRTSPSQASDNMPTPSNLISNTTNRRAAQGFQMGEQRYESRHLLEKFET